MQRGKKLQLLYNNFLSLHFTQLKFVSWMLIINLIFQRNVRQPLPKEARKQETSKRSIKPTTAVILLVFLECVLHVLTWYFASANCAELDVQLGRLIHANFAKKFSFGFWLTKNTVPLILVLQQPSAVLSQIVISSTLIWCSSRYSLVTLFF